MASLEAWRPSVQDVANLVAERTGAVDVNGELVPRGTFDADTTPTDTQVLALIAGVQTEVWAAVGGVSDALSDAAQWAVALGTAALVETQFYGDMQGPGGPGEVLTDRYRSAVAALVKADADTDDGADHGARAVAVGYFPATVPLGLATTPWEPW